MFGFKWLFASFVLASFIGCAGPSYKKAEDLYAGGAYEEAAKAYEAILAQNPGDPQATVELRKTRRKIIETKLLEVRKARQSGNASLSLNLLLEVVDSENKWKVFPEGPASYTQEEEIRRAYPQMESLIRLAVKSGHPLKAGYYMKRYEPIFSGRNKTRVEILRRVVIARGKESCDRFLAYGTRKRPYYSRFVKKFCNFWGTDEKELDFDVSPDPREFYRKVSLDLKVKSFPAGHRDELLASLEKALADSAWYDVDGGKGIHVVLGGAYNQKLKKEKVELVHEYTEKVPYTSHEPQKLKKTTKSADGTVTKEEEIIKDSKVTKFRDEARTMKYDAWKHYQDLSLRLNGSFRLKGYRKTLQLNQKRNLQALAHDQNLPKVGLQPKPLKLPDTSEWVKVQISEIATQFTQKANDLWVKLYCRPTKGIHRVATAGNRVHQCIRKNMDKYPSFVESWYKNHVGLSVEEAQYVLN